VSAFNESVLKLKSEGYSEKQIKEALDRMVKETLENEEESK